MDVAFCPAEVRGSGHTPPAISDLVGCPRGSLPLVPRLLLRMRLHRNLFVVLGDDALVKGSVSTMTGLIHLVTDANVGSSTATVLHGA